MLIASTVAWLVRLRWSPLLLLMWIKIRDIIVAVLLISILIIILTIIVWLLSGTRIHPHQAVFVLFLRPMILIVWPLTMLGCCVLGCQKVGIDSAIDL